MCLNLFFPIRANLSTDGCLLQPLMSLMFGNLTQDFVNFSTVIQNVNPNDPQSSAQVEEAAARFRHVAALDASYLVYIGAWIISMMLFGSRVIKTPPPVCRRGYVYLHLYLHVYLGLHRRGDR